jgi:AP endonuclease-2
MQLEASSIDDATLDSEGRCVILEFPAFVLFGVYSPANRDESRDDFRLGFLNVLDARIRNLVAAGKRVVVAGDLNIIKSELDSANVEEQMRKQNLSREDYISTPARRILNQLLVDGELVGRRDAGREEPVLWDACRAFHRDRRGMYTCWETKINARPGNFGSRIDYVLCSTGTEDWVCEANIQEGLLGSDHCPVYAIFKESIKIDNKSVHIKDIMNPPNMFKDGVRQQEWTTKCLLPLSAKLIPEFDRRRNIRDMFTRKASSDAKYGFREPTPGLSREASGSPAKLDRPISTGIMPQDGAPNELVSPAKSAPTRGLESMMPPPSTPDRLKKPKETSCKRAGASPETRPVKRSKSGSSKSTGTSMKGPAVKGQSSLMGFLKAKKADTQPDLPTNPGSELDLPSTAQAEGDVRRPFNTYTTEVHKRVGDQKSPLHKADIHLLEVPTGASANGASHSEDQEDVVDPIITKESWSKLFTKRVVPRCEHDEPCISYLTKKPGINCGRSFFICPRPLGPSGQKEKGTAWRCGTFIWSSDWSRESS